MITLSPKNLFAILLLLSSMAISCRRDLDALGPKPVSQNAEPTTTSELKVAEHFNWETTKKIEYEITPVKSGLLLIQSENAEVFYKAFLKAGVKHHTILTIQNKHENIYVYLNGKKEKLQLADNMKIKSSIN